LRLQDPSLSVLTTVPAEASVKGCRVGALFDGFEDHVAR
jgi:hypothetical protein